MHLSNFRQVILFAVGALVLTIGTHQVALASGASPDAAAIAAFSVAFSVAIAVIAAFSVAITTIAAFPVAIVATFPVVFTTIAAFPVAIAVIAAFPAVFTAVALTFLAELGIKFRWTALVYGIEGVAVYTALRMSVGSGALIGLGGAALLGSLWLLAPRLGERLAARPSVVSG